MPPLNAFLQTAGPARLRLADQLRHGAHRAVDTPAARFEEKHCDHAQGRGGEHQAVEAVGELSGPGRGRSVVRPLPGQFEGPEEFNELAEFFCSRKDLPAVPEHQREHGHKEGQKAEAKPSAAQKFRRVPVGRETQLAAQQREELPPAAVSAAVGLAAAEERNQQGNGEAEQAQPGEEDVEAAQQQVGRGGQPEVVVPVFFHASASRSSITEAGHSRAHFPQPTHLAAFTTARTPSGTEMAPSGQTFAQFPQPTHSAATTAVFFLFLISGIFVPPLLFVHHRRGGAFVQ